MNKVISKLKNIRPFKTIVVFLASIFLLITQACGSVGATTPAGTNPNQVSGPQSAEPNSELYVPKGTNITSPKEGGINNFSDVDPRSKTDIKAKTEALKENAQRNIQQKGVDSPQDYVRNYREGTPLGERVKRLGESVGGSAQDVTEGVTKGTQRGIENIKKNTKDAADDLSSNVQRSADDAGKAVNQTARLADDNVKYGAAYKGQNVIESAKAFIQDKTDEAANSVQRNLDNAKDAVSN